MGVPGVMMRVVAGATLAGTAGAEVITGTAGADVVIGTAGADVVTGAAVVATLAPDTATGGARAPETDTGGAVAAAVVTGALVVVAGALVVVGGGGVVVGAGVTTGTCREGARILLHSDQGCSKLQVSMVHNAAVAARTVLTLLRYIEIREGLQSAPGRQSRTAQYPY